MDSSDYATRKEERKERRKLYSFARPAPMQTQIIKIISLFSIVSHNEYFTASCVMCVQLDRSGDTPGPVSILVKKNIWSAP